MVIVSINDKYASDQEAQAHVFIVGTLIGIILEFGG